MAEYQQPHDCRPAGFQEFTPVERTQQGTFQLFDEAAAVAPIGSARGSAYAFARSVLLRTDADWQRSFPYITRRDIAELSKETNTPHAYDTVRDAHGISPEAHFALRPRYKRHIEQLAPQYTALFDEDIPRGILGNPPYLPQQGNGTCSRACFRMIFSGIAKGRCPVPSESSIIAYEQRMNAFDESALFRSLSTPSFKAKTGCAVKNRLLVGATFGDIALRAQKLAQACPGTETYVMLGIQNFDGSKPDALHAVVLLDAKGDTVTFHNPIDRAYTETLNTPWKTGGVRETLGRQEFIQRWAASLYTAHLVFAQPKALQT